jgi:hypothetical protein
MNRACMLAGLAAVAFLWAYRAPTGDAMAWEAAAGPEVPRIDSVVPSARQPQEGDAATIWYDDFNGPVKAYTETEGDLDDQVVFGGAGKSMKCLYE